MALGYPYQVHYTKVHSDIKIAWSDEGHGSKTLLFIHGLAGYLPLWRHQIDELKHSFRCVALDLPGNGLSSHGNLPYTMFFFAESVARFIEKEKLGPVILVGHSMGAHVSMILSLRFPELVEKIVLLAPSGIEPFSKSEILYMIHMMGIGQLFVNHSAYTESLIQQSFYRKNPEADSIISDLKKIMKLHKPSTWNKMVHECVISMLEDHPGPFLGQLSQPASIIFGSSDALIPNKLIHPHESTRSIGELALKKIPDSQLHFISGAGHFVHIEKPHEVNRLIHSHSISAKSVNII